MKNVIDPTYLYDLLVYLSVREIYTVDMCIDCVFGFAENDVRRFFSFSVCKTLDFFPS